MAYLFDRKQMLLVVMKTVAVLKYSIKVFMVTMVTVQQSRNCEYFHLKQPWDIMVWNFFMHSFNCYPSKEENYKPLIRPSNFTFKFPYHNFPVSSEEDWSDVSKYFTPEKWNEIPLIERRKFRTMKERCEYMTENCKLHFLSVSFTSWPAICRNFPFSFVL